MTESLISAGSPVVTLINVFTVDPANQQLRDWRERRARRQRSPEC